MVRVLQENGTICVDDFELEKEGSMLTFMSEGEDDGTKNRKREIIQKKSCFREKM